MPGLSSRALGSSLPLVLIERIAHVRGPVPGLSIRALGSSLPLVLIKRIAHVRGGGGLPSQSPSGDSVSAAASGDAAQWAAPITDRRGSGDRPLGNVPPGRSGPQRGSQVGALLKVCRKPSLASPFGGGALQRRAERAPCGHLPGALRAGKGGAKPLFP